MRKQTVVLLLAACVVGASLAGDLQREFATPPDSCKPWTYYFFENEVMDLPGITADLEALSSVGVGGLIVFAEHRDGMKTGNVKMFSKEYDAGMQHLLREATRLGLTVSLFNCAGSATAGGPWNTPEHSMKQFVWSETALTGGGPRTIKLKQPFTVAGFYRDIAVMAYPANPGGRWDTRPKPKLSAAKDVNKLSAMMDGDMLTCALFRGRSDKQRREICLDYTAPVTVGRFYAYGNLFKYYYPLEFELEVSVDGKTWQKIAAVTQQGNNPALVDFPSVTGQHFRVWASSRMDMFWIAELDLLPAGGRPRVYPQFNDWAAAIGRERGEFGSFHSRLLADDNPLNPSLAVDLTKQLQPDGSLTWDVPAGEWLVLRSGYTTSGKQNHPATAEGLGYEVDKLNPDLVRRHAVEGLRRMSGGTEDVASLKLFHLDSWEAGGQTWTEDLAAAFERLNGYSLRPFLPVLGAKLVTDAETTCRFLEDFRHTLQTLVARNFYGVVHDVARSRGLSLVAQSSASCFSMHRPLDYFPSVDIAMGEAWSIGNFTPEGNISGGLRDAISASHVLGRPVIPVEIFTSGNGSWNMSPRFLKGFGDRILAAGGNQLTLHCYIHQPTDDRAPGWTMSHYGTTFNRHVTWWKQAKPWLQTISRSQLLLRQGRSVTDLCHLLADDETLAKHAEDRSTFWDAPRGYANDWITYENLASQFHVEQGEFVSCGGARYRLLVLPEHGRITLTAVRKLHELVEAGGVILGQRPTARAGLQGGEVADREFARHVAALWGSSGETMPDRFVGKGRVLGGMTMEAALAALAIEPDLILSAANASPGLHWHHRRDGPRDIYFLANGSDQVLQATFSFRVPSCAPEIWHPETGTIQRPSVFRSVENRVELPLELGPFESLFVLFGSDAVGEHFTNVMREGQPLWPRNLAPAEGFPRVWLQPSGRTVLESSQQGGYVLEHATQAPVKVTLAPSPPPAELQGPWRVSFEGVARPDPQVFERLVAWNKHPDSSVRGFSGIGEYRSEFRCDAAMTGSDRRTWLDLGDARELAEVALNGAPLGVVWKPPFRLEVTGKLRSGRNELVIRVANTWANRLIADAALPETARHTWTAFSHYRETDAPPDSGLLGPVTLRVTAIAEVK